MSACYNLQGKASPFDGQAHVPCNLTAVDNGGHSTCCRQGDLCLTNGMCKGDNESAGNNWYWRIACTDKTWQDPACPRYCEAIEPTRNTGLIFNCLKTESWCCAYVGGSLQDWPKRASLNTTCCAIDDLTFTAPDPVVYAKATPPVKLSTQSAEVSSSSTVFSSVAHFTTASDQLLSPSPSAETSTQETSSSGSSKALPIGLGVGLSVGVILLLLVGAFFWRRHRRQHASARELDTDQPLYPKQPVYVYQHEASEQPATELPTREKVAELPGEEVPGSRRGEGRVGS